MALPFITANQAKKLEKEIELLAQEVEEHQVDGGTFFLNSLDLELAEELTTADKFYELTGIDNEALFTTLQNHDLITLAAVNNDPEGPYAYGNLNYCVGNYIDNEIDYYVLSVISLELPSWPTVEDSQWLMTLFINKENHKVYAYLKDTYLP